jgi:hypothetical protein
MTRSTAFGLALAAAGALLMTTGCSGSSDSSSTSVTAPSGTLVTDTFTGTVQPGGVDWKPFTITTGGTINVTLLAAGPPATITMGLGVGTPSSTGTCALLSGASTTAVASSSAQLNGSLAAGSYCVEVLDLGNAAGPIAYTVTVAHT